MSDDYSKMIAPRADEELHAGRESPVVMKPGEDGLPVPVAQAIFDTPPGLSPENLICMADTRSFVSRNSLGEIMRVLTPDQVQRASNGSYFILIDEDGHINSQGGSIRIDVEPVRPQCAFYMRQMTDISTDRERRFIQRACLAQRSETGEYVSLRDGALYACSLRSPRHLESEALLDAFDAGKIAEEQKKQEMASFDVDAALAGEDLGVLSSG